MPFNGSGTYNLPAGNPVVNNTTASSTVYNNTNSDIATALTNCLTKDGQSTPSADIDLAGFEITTLGNGTQTDSAANVSQLQNNGAITLSSVSGTDTITAAVSPVPSAYATGQIFVFVPAADNTGAATINISSLGAKAIYLNGGDIGAGVLETGQPVAIRYNGTQFDIAWNSSGVVEIDGGTITNSTIDSSVVGGTTPAAGTFTDLTASGTISFSGATVSNGGTVTTVDINGGTVDGTTIGSSSATTGKFTTTETTGNAGIGQSPDASYRLTVNGSSTLAQFVGANSATLQISNPTSQELLFNASGPSDYFRWATSGTDRMTLDNSGNLGLGTTTPTDTNSWGRFLDVRGTGTTTFSGVYAGNSDLTVRSYFGGGGAVGSGSGYVGTATSHPFQFFTANSERARITSGGYSKFSNNGSYNNATGSYHEFNNNSNNITVLLKNTDTGSSVVNCFSQLPASATGRHYEAFTNAATVMYIEADGDLFNTNGTYGTISDRKVKRNIVTNTTPRTPELKALRVANYELIDDPKARKLIGFVAQEFEQVFPGLVSESPDFETVEVTEQETVERPVLDEAGEPVLDENGQPVTESVVEEVTRTEQRETGTFTKQIKTSLLIPILVQGFQEQQATIEAQAAALAALEARLTALEGA